MLKSKLGFSLIELLLAIVIVGIIVAIAVPSYQDSVRKTRRADAIAMVMEAANRQERHFTEYGRYAQSIVAAQADVDSQNILLQTTSENGFYTLTLSAASATAFTLTANPQNDQTSDSCGAFIIDQAGLKTNGGSGTNCW